MPDYDFHTLSPIDFENLSRDLIQREFGILLESFTSGKDQGIDFRGFLGEENCIIQCKHYAKTGFKGLYSAIKKKELPKIKILSPQRYLLITSVPLTTKQKADLYHLIQPYIKDPKDIFGRDDINNLLGRHPDIEKKHFKLWLSSINILENILHSRILRETEQELDDIIKQSKKYVVNESFEIALKILKKYHYCIIAGIPGIGKTMLAKMLILQYIKDGYELLTISRDISDAYSIPLYDKPRIYFYDDFLGRTSITEKLGKNEDHRLVSFIERIKDSPRERLILTTREYILHQAQNIYERLDSPIFDNPLCIVDLSSYTRSIRAKILYNHLYFSSMDKSYIKSLISDKSYLEIIDHDNFNPRIIEHLTEQMWITALSNTDYPRVFKEALSKPIIIWEKVFNSQISNYARLILTILVTLPSEIFLHDLRKIFVTYLQNQSGYCDIENKFYDALRELEGNFTITNALEKGTIISFHNPSIADFLQREIERRPLTLFEVLKNANFFEQIEFVLDSELRHKLLLDEFPESKLLLKEKINKLLRQTPCKLSLWVGSKRGRSYKDRTLLQLARRLGYIASKARSKEYSYLQDIIRYNYEEICNGIQSGSFRPDDVVYLLRHMVLLPVFNKEEKRKILNLAKESIIKHAAWISELETIFDFLQLYPHMKSPEDTKRIKDKASSIVEDIVLEDDYEMLDDELFRLKNIHEKHQIPVSEEIEALEYRLIDLENSVGISHDPDWEDDYKSFTGRKSISDAQITSMFSTLIEE